MVPNSTPLHLTVLHALGKLLICDAVLGFRVQGVGVCIRPGSYSALLSMGASIENTFHL